MFDCEKRWSISNNKQKRHINTKHKYIISTMVSFLAVNILLYNSDVFTLSSTAENDLVNAIEDQKILNTDDETEEELEEQRLLSEMCKRADEMIAGTYDPEVKVGDFPSSTRYVLDVSDATGDVTVIKDPESEDENTYQISKDGGQTWSKVTVDPEWGIVMTGTMPDGLKLNMGSEKPEELIEDPPEEDTEEETEATEQENPQERKSRESSRAISGTVTWNGYSATSSVVVSGTATIKLANNSSNKVNCSGANGGGDGRTGQYAGIQVQTGATLTINSASGGSYSGMGSLTATAGRGSAGIGSYATSLNGPGPVSGANHGTIKIQGGTINATAGADCSAGIGGACYGGAGSITISGGNVTAVSKAQGAGIGGGACSNNGTISISGGTVVATGGGGAAVGIGGGMGNDSKAFAGGTVNITGGSVIAKTANTAGVPAISKGAKNSAATATKINIGSGAKLLAIAGNSSTQPIQGTVSGTTPCVIGAYYNASSGRVNANYNVRILDANGTIRNTFTIPSVGSDPRRMAMTTNGSTGTKYIQAKSGSGAYKPISKVASPSSVGNYQFSSSQTISPGVSDMYTTNVTSMTAPTVASTRAFKVMGLDDTATFNVGNPSNTTIWERPSDATITWNDSASLLEESSRGTLGTGESITATARGIEGSTKLTTSTKFRIKGTSGTNMEYDVTSAALDVSVTDGKYDLYNGPITATYQDASNFKLDFKDDDGVARNVYLPNSYPITIYQSYGETTSTTNTITIGTTSNAVGNSTTPLNLTLGEVGKPVNVVGTSSATKACIDVVGSSNLRLILPDNVSNILDNSARTTRIGIYAGIRVHYGGTVSINSMQGGEYDDMGRLTCLGGGGSAGIGSSCITSGVNHSDNRYGTINIQGGEINATAGNDCAAGVGGSCYGSAGTINISGGNVTAASIIEGAAIGSGASGANGTINISGGTVLAKGGINGGYNTVAIGGGRNDGGNGGTINITGGYVVAVAATADDPSWAIGRGQYGSQNNNTDATINIGPEAKIVAISGGTNRHPIKGNLASGSSYPRTISGRIAASSATNQVSCNDKVKILDGSGNIQNEFVVPSECTEERFFVATTNAEINYIMAEDSSADGSMKIVSKTDVTNSRDEIENIYEYISSNTSFNESNYDYLYFGIEIPTLSAPVLSSDLLIYGDTISASLGELSDSENWSIDTNSAVWSETGGANLLENITNPSAIGAIGDSEGETYISVTVKIVPQGSNTYPAAVPITSAARLLTVEVRPSYDVRISWESQNFTCTRDANGNYSWSNPSPINVENHSNVPIVVNFDYEIDHSENMYGVEGIHSQQQLHFARNNSDGQKSSSLTLSGNPFGLYTLNFPQPVGRSLLTIERDYG